MFESLIKSINQKPVSVKKGFKITDRVKPFDPLKHPVFAENKTHIQFNCPWCVEKGHREHNDGKFYWSKKKQIGFCFRCNTVGVLDDGRDYSEIQLDWMIKNLMKDEESISIEDMNLPAIQYDKMFDELDEEGIEYLDARVPFYSMFSDVLEFRVSPKVGVAVPIYYKNKIISYNLRFYNPTNGRKYYIPEGMKFLYSPTRVFDSGKSLQEITLVEGYFDALGALVDGKPNPIAIFGKTLTDFQISMLRTACPVKINIYLDEAKLSWKLYWELKGKLPTVSKIEIIPTLKYDPEERFQVRLQRAKGEELEKLLTDVQSIHERLVLNLNK